MVKEYVKELTSTEVERYCVQITKDARNMFPRPGGKMLLYHADKRFEVKVDNFYRIWIGKLKPDFLIEEGDTVVISKEPPPRTYSISKK